MASKRLFVVAGVGRGSGTGAATAREFSKAGYQIALIARNEDHLKAVSDSLRNAGGEAAPFAIPDYSTNSIRSAFFAIRDRWPSVPIRTALWNTGAAHFKPFLDLTEEDIRESLDTNLVAAFAFARESVLAFRQQDVDEHGRRGALLFTSATAATRGNVNTAAISASKSGLRALSQSLAKEFGKQDIHVATAVIDGQIYTQNQQSMAKEGKLNPEAIAKAFRYLAEQDRTAWTWELDLRPSSEKW
ncbi:NAD(P)-binding protein [Auriculariales sp. MPI-PUGE-AT-0066]|nr:NAD(P)-binding protein [Auriculariales sp. MPI-PUGE-AT-0066]